MLDLEAEMAKALDGKFFWEHTATPEVSIAPESREIVNAQRKFAKPRKKTPEERRQEKLNALAQTIAREAGNGISICKVNHHLKSDLKRFIDRLAEVVAHVHDVSTDEVTSHSRKIASNYARHHFVWAFIRYFPGVSMAQFARLIGKDRSTLVNSDERFTAAMSDYEDKIAAVDIIMGYVK